MEAGVIDAGDDGVDGQEDLGDLETVADLVDGDIGFGGDAGGGVAVRGEAVGEGHGEAGGVGSAEEFLGVGAADAVFEAGGEGVFGVEGAAVGFDGAGAFGQIALPGGFRMTSDHVNSPRKGE